MQLVHIGLVGALRQVLVTGAQLIDQLSSQGVLSQPDFPRGDRLDIQLWPITRHERLEQGMGSFQILLEFLPALFGVFAEYCQSALVLPGCQHLEINIVTLEQPMYVGQLGYYADGTQYGKGAASILLPIQAII